MIEMRTEPAAAMIGRFIGPWNTKWSRVAVVMMAVERARFLMMESQYLRTSLTAEARAGV